MSRVLFIEKKLRNEKLGIMYLSAVLKQKEHKTLMVQTDEEDIDKVIQKFKPDFLAYSIATGEHRYALKLNLELKQKYPNVISIFGGPHATFFPEMVDEQGVDFIVIGQGEKAIVDIVEERIKEKLTKVPLMEDLNSLPFPDRGLLYRYDEFKNNPVKNIITQRDCPYNCAYCYNHLWRELYKEETNKMFQRKTVGRTVREAKEIKEKYFVERFSLIDDNFIGIGEENGRK